MRKKIVFKYFNSNYNVLNTFLHMLFKELWEQFCEINWTDPFHRESSAFVLMSCQGSHWEWRPEKKCQTAWKYLNALSFVRDSEPAFTPISENVLPSQLFAPVEVCVREYFIILNNHLDSVLVCLTVCPGQLATPEIQPSHSLGLSQRRRAGDGRWFIN